MVFLSLPQMSIFLGPFLRICGRLCCLFPIRIGISVLVVWGLMIFMPAESNAQTAPLGTDLGNTIPASTFTYNSILANPQTWLQNTLGAASKLFLLLFVIELFMLGLQAALFKGTESLGQLFSSLVLKIFSAGLFYFLASVGIAPIMQTFGQLGQTVTGAPNTLLSTILSMGVTIAQNCLQTADAMYAADVHNASTQGIFSFGSGTPGLAVAAANAHMLPEWVLAGMALMAVASMAVIFMVWVGITMEAGIVMGAGIIFLGLLASRFTKSFAQGYLRYVVNVGTKLLAFWIVLYMESIVLPQATVTNAFSNIATILLPPGTMVPPGGKFPGAILGPPAPKTLALLLTYMYVPFEFMTMALIAFSIPNFAGKFVSDSSSLWESLESAGSNAGTAVTTFMVGVSALLGVHATSARENTASRGKEQYPVPSHIGVQGDLVMNTNIMTEKAIFPMNESKGSMTVNPLSSLPIKNDTTNASGSMTLFFSPPQGNSFQKVQLSGIPPPTNRVPDSQPPLQLNQGDRIAQVSNSAEQEFVFNDAPEILEHRTDILKPQIERALDVSRSESRETTTNNLERVIEGVPLVASSRESTTTNFLNEQQKGIIEERADAPGVLERRTDILKPQAERAIDVIRMESKVTTTHNLGSAIAEVAPAASSRELTTTNFLQYSRTAIPSNETSLQTEVDSAVALEQTSVASPESQATTTIGMPENVVGTSAKDIASFADSTATPAITDQGEEIRSVASQAGFRDEAPQQKASPVGAATEGAPDSESFVVRPGITAAPSISSSVPAAGLKMAPAQQRAALRKAAFDEQAPVTNVSQVRASAAAPSVSSSVSAPGLNSAPARSTAVSKTVSTVFDEQAPATHVSQVRPAAAAPSMSSSASAPGLNSAPAHATAASKTVSTVFDEQAPVTHVSQVRASAAAPSMSSSVPAAELNAAPVRSAAGSRKTIFAEQAELINAKEARSAAAAQSMSSSVPAAELNAASVRSAAGSRKTIFAEQAELINAKEARSAVATQNISSSISASRLSSNSDGALAPTPSIRVYRIDLLDATSVADSIRWLFKDIEVSVDKNQNVLSVTAAAETQQRVADEITLLDVPTS